MRGTDPLGGWRFSLANPNVRPINPHRRALTLKRRLNCLQPCLPPWEAPPEETDEPAPAPLRDGPELLNQPFAFPEGDTEQQQDQTGSLEHWKRRAKDRAEVPEKVMPLSQIDPLLLSHRRL